MKTMKAKDLKNALLQEAVQGKLVPQIAAEGNAADLLNAIRKEKAELIKAGKLKKEKPLPPITDDEKPFDIPESWCWCRLGDLGFFVRGNGIKRSETVSKGYPCVRYGEMYTTYKIQFSETKSFTTKDIFDKCQKVHTDDILMALTGENKWDIALAAVYQGKEELALGGDLCKFSPIMSYPLFLVYFINSPIGIEYKRNTATGDIIVHISADKLANIPIPLPPLSEQKRIVAAIEQFMPLIDEYGKKEEVLSELNAAIGGQAKKALLQEAVQGKLVPQIAAEGNAADLLKQIQAEKAQLIKAGKLKKEKPLPPITDEEKPFDIPESWCWCRLGEIVYNNGQKKPDKEFSYIDIGSIDNEHQRLNEKETIIQPNNAPSRARKIVRQGDIIYSTVRPYLHNMCIIYKTFKKEPIASTGFAVMSCFPQVLNKFLFYYLLSPIFDNYANDTDNSKGVAYHAINDEKLYKGIIPLPPLTEQKRIVSALEKMLPLCERLGK